MGWPAPACVRMSLTCRIISSWRGLDHLPFPTLPAHTQHTQRRRFDRAANNPNSRRAKADARHAAKHAAKVAEGELCEHGVWKCRICFPHKTGK